MYEESEVVWKKVTDEADGDDSREKESDVKNRVKVGTDGLDVEMSEWNVERSKWHEEKIDPLFHESSEKV